MQYEVRWYIENEVILLRYSGVMNLEGFKASMIELKELFRSAPGIVHSITDFTRVDKQLAYKDVIIGIRELGKTPINGWDLSVGDLDTIAKFSMSVARTILNVKSASFKTMDEALDYLQDKAPDLQWDHVMIE